MSSHLAYSTSRLVDVTCLSLYLRPRGSHQSPGPVGGVVVAPPRNNTHQPVQRMRICKRRPVGQVAGPPAHCTLTVTPDIDSRLKSPYVTVMHVFTSSQHIFEVLRMPNDYNNGTVFCRG